MKSGNRKLARDGRKGGVGMQNRTHKSGGALAPYTSRLFGGRRCGQSRDVSLADRILALLTATGPRQVLPQSAEGVSAVVAEAAMVQLRNAAYVLMAHYFPGASENLEKAYDMGLFAGFCGERSAITMGSISKSEAGGPSDELAKGAAPALLHGVFDLGIRHGRLARVWGGLDHFGHEVVQS